DYAYSAEVAVQLKDYTVRTETSYIGPGYTSLGVYYLLNDQQIHAISADARLLERKLNLRANFRTRNDNLLDQKMYTTRRNSALFGINVRPLPTLLLVFNTNLNTIANDSDNDTLRVDMNIQGYTLVANYQFPLRQWTTNLNTTYSFQNSGDENPLRQTSNVTVNNFNAAYSVQLTQSWTVNTNLNYSDTQISGRNGVTMMGVGGGATHTALKRRLNTTFNLSFNNAQTGSTLGIVLNSSFRLTAKDNFSITFRNIGYTPDEEDIIREEESISIVPKRYNETIFTMRLTRRF
ncbi:hypothetical protein JW935_27100, partial [candidate division KSB1 bacterium]|nr:hypothetical protein [candidate division KSB1 bacterium]